MTIQLSEFQEFVKDIASPRSMRDFESQLLTSGLGLAGEAGECADWAKKVVFHGGEFNREKYILELSDVMWYIAFSANMLGITIEEIVEANVQKLRERYKSGKFSVQEFLDKEAQKQ